MYIITFLDIPKNLNIVCMTSRLPRLSSFREIYNEYPQTSVLWEIEKGEELCWGTVITQTLPNIILKHIEGGFNNIFKSEIKFT